MDCEKRDRRPETKREQAKKTKRRKQRPIVCVCACGIVACPPNLIESEKPYDYGPTAHFAPSFNATRRYSVGWVASRVVFGSPSWQPFSWAWRQKPWILAGEHSRRATTGALCSNDDKAERESSKIAGETTRKAVADDTQPEQ